MVLRSDNNFLSFHISAARFLLLLPQSYNAEKASASLSHSYEKSSIEMFAFSLAFFYFLM